MKDYKVKYVPIGEVKPYKKNPRINDMAVDGVAKSIKEYGFQQPIVVDAKYVVIAVSTLRCSLTYRVVNQNIETIAIMPVITMLLMKNKCTHHFVGPGDIEFQTAMTTNQLRKP